MTRNALVPFIFLATMVSPAARADGEVQALVVPLHLGAGEKTEPMHVAVPDLPGFLREAGIRSTSELAKTDPERLAQSLVSLEVVGVDESRDSRVTLGRRHQTTPLGKVHETAPMSVARVLTLGARELPGAELTTKNLVRLLELGAEAAGPPPPRF